MSARLTVFPEECAVYWTAAEEFSGRREFNVWRFTEARNPVPWDWADMTSAEKDPWIQQGKRTGTAAGMASLLPDMGS